MENLNTLHQAVDWVEQQLALADLHYGHGTDNARDEAAWLVLGALGLSFNTAESDLPASLSSPQKQQISNILRQRIESRIPLAYLLRQAWFCGMEFYVDERVLIPRSPVAELIDECFVPWMSPGEVDRILDIGTGSGCIAIAAAMAFPTAQVDAVDISEDALAVAKINVEHYGLKRRLKLHQSNLFEDLQPAKYDIIIANPPYVDAEDMAVLPAEYRHEPRRALEAGDDGLDLVRLIIEQSRAYLAESGILVVEVGNSQPAVERAFPGISFLWLEFSYGGQGVFLLTAAQLDGL